MPQQPTKSKIIIFIIVACLTAGSSAAAIIYQQQLATAYQQLARNFHLALKPGLQTPFIQQLRQEPKPLPLKKYSIPNLANYPYQTSKIKIRKLLDQKPEFNSYQFTYDTDGKTMSGMVNIPQQPQQQLAAAGTKNEKTYPVIILIRGWVPAASYQTGVGTRHAAQTFARHGYVTLAPDFFGYGASDQGPDDSWEARFIKPVNIIELIKTIQAQPKIQPEPSEPQTAINLNPDQLGMWAHSNGGQIALTTLEALSRPIPTTLWAPVTAPFPYSILFFSDEHDDEGKAMRAWLAQFEQDYDVFDFTLTQHLNRLTGPLIIHHGTADEAALKTWSDEFVNKLEAENKRRAQLKKAQQKPETQTNALNDPEPQSPQATDSAQAHPDPNIIEPIDFNYHAYLGADHNLQPSQHWNQAINRDLNFFQQQW